MVDYVRDPTPHDDFHGGSATWVVRANMWLVKSRRLFIFNCCWTSTNWRQSLFYCCTVSMEQATDEVETAAIDGLVSSWSENISVQVCLRIRIDSVMHPRCFSRGHNTSALVTVTEMWIADVVSVRRNQRGVYASWRCHHDCIPPLRCRHGRRAACQCHTTVCYWVSSEVRVVYFTCSLLKASSPQPGYVAALCVKNCGWHWYGACRGCLVPSVRMGIWTKLYK